MAEYQRKYRWRHTWGDIVSIDGKRHEDYQGFDGAESIGRIYLETAGLTKNLWRWAGGRPQGSILPHSGYCFAANDAARKVEEYWDAMKARESQNESGGVS